MTKEGIIRNIAESTLLNYCDAEEIVNKFIEEIEKAMLAGNKVVIKNFGTFYPKERSARTARDIRKGEEIIIPARKEPAFKPSKVLRDKIHGEKE